MRAQLDTDELNDNQTWSDQNWVTEHIGEENNRKVHMCDSYYPGQFISLFVLV